MSEPASGLELTDVREVFRGTICGRLLEQARDRITHYLKHRMRLQYVDNLPRDELHFEATAGEMITIERFLERLAKRMEETGNE